MRKVSVPLAVAGLCAAAALFLPHPGVHAQDEGIQWLSSYKEAVAEAKRTGKPIFLEFRCEP